MAGPFFMCYCNFLHWSEHLKQVLVYADSLSWGIIPGTRRRLEFHQRWPGLLEIKLKQYLDVRIIENCLNGRRTVWEDPYKEGRNGAQGLAQVIEMHSPLNLLILMLGTNDFQNSHNHSAWASAQGVAKLVGIIQQAPVEPGMSIPEIMVIIPPTIRRPRGDIGNKFAGAESRCIGLSEEMQKVAEEKQVLCLDSNDVISASKIDGIHLDADQHEQLADAIVDYLQSNKILSA